MLDFDSAVSSVVPIMDLNVGGMIASGYFCIHIRHWANCTSACSKPHHRINIISTLVIVVDVSPVTTSAMLMVLVRPFYRLPSEFNPVLIINLVPTLVQNPQLRRNVS